jgi:hypothetical protein
VCVCAQEHCIVLRVTFVHLDEEGIESIVRCEREIRESLNRVCAQIKDTHAVQIRDVVRGPGNLPLVNELFADAEALV